MQHRSRLVSLVSGQRRVAVAWMQRRSRLVSLAYSRVGVAPGRGGRYRPEASPWPSGRRCVSERRRGLQVAVASLGERRCGQSPLNRRGLRFTLAAG